MKANVGKTDKLIRLLLALAGLILYIFNVVQGTFGIIVLIIAAILIITSIVNFCPLYAVLGIKTCKSQESR
ncbi:MAG TPA: DUF2892 domain-containing protein [Bacteroidales bacterium]|nr:DUF2892 domain-containing protein [Bacteroidales bacterium]